MKVTEICDYLWVEYDVDIISRSRQCLDPRGKNLLLSGWRYHHCGLRKINFVVTITNILNKTNGIKQI